MSWARLDDGWWSHPKVVAAGNAAAGLYAKALTWSSQYLTDGRIPKASTYLLLAGDDPALCERLVEVGLWRDDGDAWVVPDYLDYNPSKAQVLAERGQARERMRTKRGGNGSSGNGSGGKFAGTNGERSADVREKFAGTNGERSGEQQTIVREKFAPPADGRAGASADPAGRPDPRPQPGPDPDPGRAPAGARATHARPTSPPNGAHPPSSTASPEPGPAGPADEAQASPSEPPIDPLDPEPYLALEEAARVELSGGELMSPLVAAARPVYEKLRELLGARAPPWSAWCGRTVVALLYVHREARNVESTLHGVDPVATLVKLVKWWVAKGSDWGPRGVPVTSAAALFGAPGRTPDRVGALLVEANALVRPAEKREYEDWTNERLHRETPPRCLRELRHRDPTYTNEDVWPEAVLAHIFGRDGEEMAASEYLRRYGAPPVAAAPAESAVVP